MEGNAAGVQHEKAVPEGVRRSIRRGYTEKEKGNSEAKESENYCGKHQTHDIQQWQMRGWGQKQSQLTREPEITDGSGISNYLSLGRLRGYYCAMDSRSRQTQGRFEQPENVKTDP